ncbi:MAG: hypothetical protein ACRCZF_08640, partial [Gemmataceae bacterium]
VALGANPTPRNAPSGINLGKPADSGVSLEKTDEDSDDFELSLDTDDSDPGYSPVSGPKSARIPAMTGDTDSEFELTLDDNSGITDQIADDLEADGNQRDIFETDFELPAVSDDVDSGSEVVALDSADTDLENSDFDLALDEADMPEDDDSASQVVMVDDDEPATEPVRGRGLAAAGAAAAAVGGMAASRGRKAASVVDDDEDDAASALSGVRDDDDEDDVVPAGAPVAPAKWGALPAAVLIPTLLLTFLGSIMSMEMLRGMWGYSQGASTGGSVVRGMADTLGMPIKEK